MLWIYVVYMKREARFTIKDCVFGKVAVNGW